VMWERASRSHHNPAFSAVAKHGGRLPRRRNRMEDSVKLTNAQRRLLTAAAQPDDRAFERPSNLTGGAAGKVVAKLLTEGLVEEIQSRGSLPIWRRDEDGSRSLRITRKGLQAIQVQDEAPDSAAPAK